MHPAISHIIEAPLKRSLQLNSTWFLLDKKLRSQNRTISGGQMGNGLLDFQKRCHFLILAQMQDIGKATIFPNSQLPALNSSFHDEQ
jgi:hypothetical protein